MTENKKYTTISIPTPLANKIKKHIEGTGFHSLSAYTTYVLREIMSNMNEDSKEAFSKENEAKVKERLRSLGYID